MPRLRHLPCLLLAAFLFSSDAMAQTTLDLQLRFQAPVTEGDHESRTRSEQWLASETAIIVCDVWDYHHCLNAVRRLEEFVPRLNAVLTEARRRGVTIIHAPSDCMDAYRDHPARQRAISTPRSTSLPHAIESWCSALPAEASAPYPIDQSDGGEDDDPQEHAEWAAKLEAMGRDPSMPWKQQSPLLTIDADADFISDRGDEVWNILDQRGIKNVILTGVHTNMCVLGRPFGLRQMARNGKNVVLMRDMTDTMYNPDRWPKVSHHEGTRRVISHIERLVCPTITSDQLLGGTPFRFADDTEPSERESAPMDPTQHWVTVSVPDRELPMQVIESGRGVRWYRCVVRIPSKWAEQRMQLKIRGVASPRVWVNGVDLSEAKRADHAFVFEIPGRITEINDHNLVVVRLADQGLERAPVLTAGSQKLLLAGQWQFRLGQQQESYSSMPLPAKFGGAADVVFAPDDPLWTPRALTRPHEFTDGIEGPACDRDGNVFAVNYQAQGTIGRVQPNGLGSVFVRLPEGSVGNGIRFAPDGTFFVADYVGHNILRVDPQTRQIRVHAHQPAMHQPNDLSLAPDGETLYASDPNWAEGTGQIWRIDRDGTTTRLVSDMGTTNGIEVSPDGTTLYVNESLQRRVWAFAITPQRTLDNRRLVKEFPDHGFDGMRCDVDGNLYITRYGKGTVVKMTPEGDVLREIPVLGSRPSNLCFGGADRRTVYVTEVEYGRLVSFRADRPGRN